MRSERGRGLLCGSKWAKALAAVALSAAAPVAFAHGVAEGAQSQGAASTKSLGEAFTFMFVTLRPLNVIGPFAAMTHGRDAAFKRCQAFDSFLVAATALLVAATIGAKPPQA